MAHKRDERGLKYGYWEHCWWSKGTLESRGYYEKNMKQGLWEYYHFPDSELYARGIYKNGKRFGPWEYYRIDGSLQRKGIRKNDKKIGLWLEQNKLVAADAQAYKEEENKKNKKTGVMKKFLESLSIYVQWQGWRWHLGLCIQLVVGLVSDLIMLLTLGIVYPQWVLPIISWRLKSPFFESKKSKKESSQ